MIAAPFVAGVPAGARVRTRLRVSAGDAAVPRAAGSYLGSLAGGDLAARCAEGRLDAKGRAVSRRERKRALTAGSSSRWAGAITRASEDQWQLADRNLRAERASLRARVRRIEARAAVPAGGKNGRVRGYPTPAERHAKAIRLKALNGRLSEVQRRPPAATRHQDRPAPPDHGRQPGGPAPYGTAGTAGPSPARSIRNGARLGHPVGAYWLACQTSGGRTTRRAGRRPH